MSKEKEHELVLQINVGNMVVELQQNQLMLNASLKTEKEKVVGLTQYC